MSRITLAALVSSCLFTATCPAQTRETKVQPKDFPTIVKEANASFTAKDYSKAIDKLREAMALAAEALRKALVAVMPPPAEGLEAQAVKRPDARGNPYAAAMLSSTAIPFEHRYVGAKGKNMTITIHVKSAMVSVVKMGLAVAANSPNHEKIGYKEHEGVLEKQRGGKRLQLQIILFGKHLISVVTNGMTDEELFAMINQAFVEAVAKILGE